MLMASSNNYPGGEALAKLHELEKSDQAVVHIGNYAAQTGVSRFGQLFGKTTYGNTNTNWIYNKTENLDFNTLVGHPKFTHLLVDDIDDKVSSYVLNTTYKLLQKIHVFNGYNIDYKNWHMPISIKKKSAIAILKRMNDQK